MRYAIDSRGCTVRTPAPEVTNLQTDELTPSHARFDAAVLRTLATAFAITVNAFLWAWDVTRFLGMWR